jgi:hypothetical protein
MPKPVLTLAAAWAEFEAMVFDDGVSRAAKIQARRVFYAGAQASLNILMAGLEPESKVTDSDIQRVAALRAELRKFGEDVEAGRS